jgi:hypothetical protein
VTIGGIARWTCWLAGIVAFVVVLAQTDVHGAMPIVLAIGPIALLGLVPYLGQIALDALAWRTLLGGLGHEVRWPRLIAIRLATEAVLLSLPGGTLVGESLKPYLLARDVPVADTVATIGAKRCLLALAQATYLGIALAIGGGLYVAYSRDIIGSDALPYLVLGAIGLLVTVAVAIGLAFVTRSPAEKVRRVLRRLPSKRLRDSLDARIAGFRRTDAGFVALGKRPGRLATAGALLVGAWLFESLETWLLCRLVGIELAIPAVIAMEAAVVVARNVAFFVPAGLGVQDAGYLAFLAAYGVAAPAATAFVIAKRVKELVWTVAGYLVLFALDARPFAAPAREGAS